MNLQIARAASLVVLFLAGASFSSAQNKSVLQLAKQYSQALTRIEKSRSRQSLENLFLKGAAVGEKLDEMENLPESEYALLEKRMRGFVINRVETVYVKSDNAFFKNLARRRGTAADVAFFNLAEEFRPGNVWAAFIQQQTDYSGCTDYGTGTLTRLHGKIYDFRRKFPSAYSSEVREMLEEINYRMTESTCACADQNSVAKEFRLFIKTFPKDKLTAQIKKRLKAIESKKSEIRFNCMSG